MCFTYSTRVLIINVGISYASVQPSRQTPAMVSRTFMCGHSRIQTIRICMWDILCSVKCVGISTRSPISDRLILSVTVVVNGMHRVPEQHQANYSDEKAMKLAMCSTGVTAATQPGLYLLQLRPLLHSPLNKYM